MDIDAGTDKCPKCDAILNEQTDGSRLHLDIAHNGETVAVALIKLDQAIEEARSGYAESIRFVLGSGVIREEVLSQLNWLRSTGAIVDFSEDGKNRGAIIVSIR